MPASSVIKNFTDGTLLVEDGTGTPLSVTLLLDEGNVQLSGLAPNLRNHTDYERKGVWVGSRQTTRNYPTLSFSAMVSHLSDASAGTLNDMILGNGEFTARKSTSESNGDIITLKVTHTVEGTDFGDSADEVNVFNHVHFMLDFAEGDPNKVSYSGSVKGDVEGPLAQAEG